MAEQKLHSALKALCDSLESLSEYVVKSWNNDAVLIDQFGWNHPAADRHSLSRYASNLADVIQKQGTDTIDESLLKIVKNAKLNVDKLKEKVVVNFYNGHGHQAIPVYISTLALLHADLEPILGWQTLRDTNLLPAKLARRLQSFQAQLDEIIPNKDELLQRISLISEATEAAESLPADLASLKTARNKIEQFQNDSLLLHQKITEHLAVTEQCSKSAIEYEGKAASLVSKCEQAYQITTTKGLAAAFDQRASSLNNSMWAWVIALVGALTAGYFLGSERLTALADVLNAAPQQKTVVLPNALLTFLSLGAPIWLAWLATKQIGQRFRLAEDYAFKASVAKAYEGYRKEAARIDEKLEARLFASALTRLEEAPLRLVEGTTHGSPWHEFLESSAFHKALKIVPELQGQLGKLAKRASRKVGGGNGDEVNGAQDENIVKR